VKIFFLNLVIDEMHSKLKKDEKDKVMKKFESGETNILVSTSVVEVGVNVPNATSIIIEGAERFGLAQLHQLKRKSFDEVHIKLIVICSLIQRVKLL
jgi:ATP-dependent DNA helicase RecG